MKLTKILFFTAFSLNAFSMENTNTTGETGEGQTGSTVTATCGTPNPSATFCLENGGEYRIVTTSAGQDGVCRFAESNTECGAWAYVRGECKVGECSEWSTEARNCAVWAASVNCASQQTQENTNSTVSTSLETTVSTGTDVGTGCGQES